MRKDKSNEYIDLSYPSFHLLNEALLDISPLGAQDSLNFHVLLLSKLKSSYCFDDGTAEQAIELEEKTSDSLQKVIVIFMIGHNEVYQILNKLLIFILHAFIAYEVLRKVINLFEILEKKLLMLNFAFTIRISKEVSKNFKPFNEFVLLDLITVDHRLNVSYSQIYRFNMEISIRFT
jgi:hypothetical protein